MRGARCRWSAIAAHPRRGRRRRGAVVSRRAWRLLNQPWSRSRAPVVEEGRSPARTSGPHRPHRWSRKPDHRWSRKDEVLLETPGQLTTGGRGSRTTRWLRKDEVLSRNLRIHTGGRGKPVPHGGRGRTKSCLKPPTRDQPVVEEAGRTVVEEGRSPVETSAPTVLGPSPELTEPVVEEGRSPVSKPPVLSGRRRTRSPPSTGCTEVSATRSTVPATGVVIEASIFIASIVATVSPAATCCPFSTMTVTVPWKGAATWPGSPASAFSAAATAEEMLRSRMLERSQLPVEGAHHGAEAALVRLADGLEPEQQRDALTEADGVLGARAQPVEVVEGGEDRHVAVRLARLQEVLGRAGEEQPVERRRAGRCAARRSGRR